jgi:intein/homing endonuclease
MADLFRKIVEPFVRRNRWSKAAQQQHFKRVYNTFDRQGEKYGKQQIPSATDMADVSAVSAIDFQKQTGYFNSFVYNSEPGKLNRLKVYRDMSFFPEIGFAIGEVVDECVNFNDQGEFVQFNIKNNRLSQNENIVANLVKEWKYVLHDVMNAKENVYEWFNDYMIDGEIFFEKVIDPTTVKERGLIRVKRLRPEFTHTIWEPDTEQVYQFVHKNESNILVLPPEAVAYANSGIYAWEDRWTKIVLSYLERAKIDYRKLKQMEDAVVIYRLCLDEFSRIRTNTGWKYIKDVEIGDTVYSYKDGKQYETKVSNKWNNGTKEVVRVRSHHSELTCTPDHPILVRNKKTKIISYIQAQDLIPKVHQLINVKNDNKQVDTPIIKLFGEPWAKLTDRTFIRNKKFNVSKTEFIKNIAKDIDYKFNRIWQFLYTDNKSLPLELAKKICERLEIPESYLEIVNKGECNSSRIHLPDIVNAEFAKLFGFLIGDGTVHKHNIVFAEGEYPELNDYYSGLLKKFFGKCERSSNKDKKFTSYYTSSIIGVKVFENLGYIHGHDKKRIPEWVFTSSDEIKMAFIEGLSDADGSERYTYKGTWFTTIKLSNRQLVEDIKELWASMGLCSGLIKKTKGGPGKFGERIINRSDSYSITLTKLPLPEYENVCHVDQIGTSTVYDIEVCHDEHNFIVNNIPVHNCKGTEKRVFTIEVGKLPKPKAEAYVQQLMRKYRQRKTYNPESGEAGEIYDPQAMVEDFFFISQDGKGSKVETLPGGQNLSEIDDVTYFLKKLYRGLRIPISRLNEEAGFSLGDTSDVTRDEYRFHKMCTTYSQRFSTVFKQVFMSHLQLKGYVDEFGISDRDIDVSLLSNNLFEEYFQNNIMSLRTENMEKLMQFAQSDEEGKKPLLSGKFVMKKCLKLTPSEIQENTEMLKQEEAEAPVSIGDGSGGGGGGGGLEDLPDLGGEDTGGGPDETPDLGGDETGGGESKPKSTSGPDLESFAQ